MCVCGGDDEHVHVHVQNQGEQGQQFIRYEEEAATLVS